MTFFQSTVADDLCAVNQLILENLESDVALVGNVGSYIVDSGGKRLRPVLVLLSALANGYANGYDHQKIAAVIEFIHTATLLHDDVVDLSELRRGRQTANAVWGNAPSVLVGDFLYSRAFQILVDIADMDVMGTMANATNVISEGEVQQLANAGNADLQEQTYLEVIYRKTAKLFEAGCECGAIIADGNRAAMANYGKYLGMAFQIADDVLDLKGDVEITGKNIGDDLAEGKLTLPVIFARDNASAEEAQLLRSAFETKSADKFDQVLDIVTKSGGLEYSFKRAREHCDLAKQAINSLKDTEQKQILIRLADFAIARNA
jgi:octaprenyl-diphosphate synthase